MPPVDELPKFGFHRDGGFEGWWTERPSPRVTAKAIYYISDCSVAGTGNTWCADQRRPPCVHVFIRVLTRTVARRVVPGSHARGAPSAGLEEVRGLDEATGQPQGAIPVRCRPGDALIFDRRLLHSGTPNWSSHDRLLFIIGWGYRWLKARDSLYVEPALARSRCAVRSQMLGASTSAAGLYQPSDEDTPLRLWLQRNSLDTQGGRGFEHVERMPVAPHWAAQSRLLGDDVGPASLPRHPERSGAGGRAERRRSYNRSGRLVELSPDAETRLLEVLDEPPRPEQVEAEVEAVVAAVEIDAVEWSRSALTPDERAVFEAEGVLVVHGALQPEETAALADAALAIHQQAPGADEVAVFTESRPSAQTDLPQLGRLIANPRVLAKVVGILDSGAIALTNASVTCIAPSAAAGAEPPDMSFGRCPSAALDRDMEVPGRPKLLITPIFHDFYRFFPVFPGTFGRVPWIPGVQTLKMGERWGKMGKKWVKNGITGVQKTALMHASAGLAVCGV